MNWLKKIFSKHTSVSDDRDPNQSNAYDLIGGDKVIRAIANSFYQKMASSAETQAFGPSLLRFSGSTPPD